MKRFLVCLALGAGLLSGCSESQSAQTTAGLSGTYDLTVVGDYVFVTSTDRNELRVLDLNASPRDWVRAPNPLEPLSIPVLERPSSLTRDVNYDFEITQDGQGTETGRALDEGTGGPYLYARSSGSSEISVVAADSAFFKQLKRLDTSGFITAFAARGPVRDRTRVLVFEGEEVVRDEITRVEFPRKDSVLYYAVQEGLDAKLFKVTIPGLDTLTQDTVLTPEAVNLTLTGQTVTALLVLPPPQDQLGQELLVVATRSTVGSGGETFRLDVNNPLAPRVSYNFGGPVRLLATHARVATTALEPDTCELDTTPPVKGSLRVGEYVFAALDESVCTSDEQESCSGIVAVEADSGARALDSTSTPTRPVPMIPIRVGQALPTGLTLAANARMLVRCGAENQTPLQTRPLVGIVASSNGTITFFDAVKLRPFDLGPANTAASADQQVVDINGDSKVPSGDFALNHIDLDVREGATRDETYRVLFEGALQGLSGRPLSDETKGCADSRCRFLVEKNAVTPEAGEVEAMIRLGDLITLANEGGICPTDIVVTEIQQDGPEGRGVLVAGPLPGDCSDPLRFTVRAGAQYPLVVYSDSRGYLGRLPAGGTPANQPFKIPGGYYYHPANFSDDPNFQTASAYLRVYNLDPLALVRGDQLIVTAQSGLLPYIIGVDTATVSAGLTSYRLPGPVVHKRVGDADFAYIAYPSADGILQVSLGGVVDNAANVRGLVPFE